MTPHTRDSALPRPVASVPVAQPVTFCVSNYVVSIAMKYFAVACKARKT